MDHVAMQILMWALPSGCLSSMITWFVTRRQRDNDFLAELQKSLNLLSNEYTKALNENVGLKADNAHLLANQKVMEEKIDALNRKIDQLTKQLKNNRNEKSNQGNSSRAASRRSANGILRSNQELVERADNCIVAEQSESAIRSTGRCRSQCAASCSGADAGRTDDDSAGLYGTSPGADGDNDDSDVEPP